MSDNRIRIWTICSENTYSRLVANNELLADPKLIDADLQFSYDWMTQELNKSACSEVKSPWWGWHSYGKKHGRPDLRCSNHMPQGTKSVLMELLLPSNEVLLSQFELWHCVLNGSRVSESEEEEAEHELMARRGTDSQRPKSIQGEKVATWQRIFDLEFGCEDYWGVLEKRWIQACYPILRLNDMVQRNTLSHGSIA